ncbi:uncharacterized protein EI97DRAFT_426868 [Westerdykella ornata]|uniref:C2H2-type domain-containing protein n=1 Tax=Westerdykella ornata TaxID=318751 RepID=A0A6A6J7P7_WESOR|nr:uncharacterized protein EI97DRAFT_426868 [Westerdykella ornata]KAF2272193.1 hypothetical protein EI97DRAFT_426868 [Westerdykella ornata]
MNYANMIEEKNLKKTFIIATLCSTLIGTFTSSMGLWDRINEKRKQKKIDYKQDDQIKELKEKVEKAEQRFNQQQNQFNNRQEDLGNNFHMSGAMIQRQYDEGYGRLGRRFAMGDTLTENQLQAQVISLQQAVITVLQDALYNDRQLSRADLSKLIAASNQARDGSLDALRQHQQRLALEAPPPRSLPSTSSSSTRSSSSLSADGLFCRYAIDLQTLPNKPLAADFAPGGRCRCPACGVRIDATADDFWKIGKRTPVLISENRLQKQVFENREFVLGQRFVIKCHTPDGQYACVLCNQFKDVDALCRSVESLVKHVGNFHSAEELSMDPDLRENRAVERRVSLPLPPPPMGSVTREKQVKEVVYR